MNPSTITTTTSNNLSNAQTSPANVAEKSGKQAAVREALFGVFQVFGMGHFYSGRSAHGVVIMISYWIALAINLVACFFLVGFLTLPLTWLAFMVFSPLQAAAWVQRDRREVEILQTIRS